MSGSDPLPRSDGHEAPAKTHQTRRTLAGFRSMFRNWHAGCILFLPGCLYVGPPYPWSEELNTPPVIEDPQSAAGGPVLVTIHQDQQDESEERHIWVVAYDEDGDDLAFDWFFPSGTCCAVGATSPGWSEATLFANKMHEDDAISCHVSDGVNEPVIVRFQIETVGAGGAE